MFPFPVIDQKAKAALLPYLVIGGHAVNVYAEPRATLDVDVLVRREDKQKWAELLRAEGFRLQRDAGTFLQFSPPYGTPWRVDLMLVNETTFSQMAATARPVTLIGTEARVPSPEHLIALKLHALVHGPEDRQEKDFGDVVGILRNTALDLEAENMRELFRRFGTQDLYDKLRRRLGSGAPQ